MAFSKLISIIITLLWYKLVAIFEVKLTFNCQHNRRYFARNVLRFILFWKPKLHALVTMSFLSTQPKTSQTWNKKIATSLSISSSCNKSVKISLVATCHNAGLFQLVETICNKRFEIINLQQVRWQLATSLLTTCNRLVVNKLSQAMRTHPDIGLL